MATRSKSRSNQWSPTNGETPARGPVASVVRWLLGLIATVVMAALLVVVVVGAFNFGTGAGLGALLGAVAVAYFMVRER